ncbi:ABC transporter ATP-binding protein [bacterium AH-315-L21]|nr:ABC transporter ATP-binding protein [bacterium AH-315-L21]
MNKIEVKGVTKVYNKKTKALDNISITIEPNKIYGLLGRNGAGKTTLLNILTTKIFPTSGEITIGGEEVFENDKVLGKIFYIMVDSAMPWAFHRVFKRMKDFYPDFDIEYAKELADRFDIDVSKKSKVLSTGEFSLFKAILALASNAEILLLDEPVLGVDPNHREMLYKEMIKNYSEKPKTII